MIILKSHLMRFFLLFLLFLVSMMMSFEKKGLFPQEQSGLRVGHSTQTVVAKLIGDIRKSFDDNEVTLLVLYDFSKAFNSVDHYTLLKILKYNGVEDDALMLVFSYPTGRCLRILGSSVGNCSCGVGQGSGPGGIFFRAHINRAVLIFVFAKLLIFVDDIQAYISTEVHNINHAIMKMNADSDGFCNWARQTGLRLNAEKTAAVILGSARIFFFFIEH